VIAANASQMDCILALSMRLTMNTHNLSVTREGLARQLTVLCGW